MNKHFIKEETWMANGDLKICSTSLVIREMQIKTIENYHFMQTHLAKVKKADKFSSWHKAMETLLHGCWEQTQAKPLWKTIWHCHIKWNKHTLHNPAVLFLESPVQVHLEIHFRMFTAASFVITRKLETKQMSMDGNIFKQWKTIHERKQTNYSKTSTWVNVRNMMWSWKMWRVISFL